MARRRHLRGTGIADSASATPFTGAGGLTNVNGTVYFAASTTAAGRELCLPAGATAATMVRDATPGTAGADPVEIVEIQGTFGPGALIPRPRRHSK